MTCLSSWVAHRHVVAQEQLGLRSIADEVSDRARNRVARYRGLLRGVRGLFFGSVAVEADEFAEYIHAMELPELPALRAAVYAPSVDGSVTIEYAEPAPLRDELVGKDLIADPSARWAVLEASAGTDPIASSSPTFWMLLHIPAPPGRWPSTPPGVKRPGFAGIQVRGDILWQQLASDLVDQKVGYRIQWATPTAAVSTLYEEGWLGHDGRTLEGTFPLDIPGAAWTLHVVAAPDAIAAMRWMPWFLASAGTLASAMLFSLMYVQIARRRSAERLTELRDQFLAAAAHELKTPVTTIKGYAQLLREWAPEQVQRRGSAALATINRQADRINRLVQDMLETSRLQLHELTLARTFISVDETVRTVIEDLQASLPDHPIVVASEGDTTVFADRGRIEQVIGNLVTNAAKFSPSQSEIRVRVCREPDSVVVSVQDRGIGIPADRQEHVFERFYQAHEGTADEAIGGLGLGLYVSKQIILRHGGTICFESEEGKGSTFSFSLPVDPQPGVTPRGVAREP